MPLSKEIYSQGASVPKQATTSPVSSGLVAAAARKSQANAFAKGSEQSTAKPIKKFKGKYAGPDKYKGKIPKHLKHKYKGQYFGREKYKGAADPGAALSDAAANMKKKLPLKIPAS